MSKRTDLQEFHFDPNFSHYNWDGWGDAKIVIDTELGHIFLQYPSEGIQKRYEDIVVCIQIFNTHLYDVEDVKRAMLEVEEEFWKAYCFGAKQYAAVIIRDAIFKLNNNNRWGVY